MAVCRSNLTGYYYRYTDLQVGVSTITPSGSIALETLNAASADVKGIDFDVAYALPQVQGLTLRSTMNYDLSRYTSFPNAPCSNGQLISEGCNQLFSDGAFHAQDLTGRPLVRAPNFTSNTGFDYKTPVGQSMTLAAAASVAYTSNFYTALIDRDEQGFRQGGYAKANASLALKSSNDAWEVALIGVNLSNKITAAACVNAAVTGALIFGGEVSGTNTRGPGGDDYPYCQAERGREVWLRLTVRPAAFLHR